MKFLCVKCDEQMILNGVENTGNDSVGIRFVCGKCAGEVAMITNPMETQMVKSLGVKVGGGDSAYEPMEMILDSLKSAESDDKGLTWDPVAEERLSRVPEMARPMARMAIEKHARAKGVSIISTAVMDEARKRYE